MSVVLTAACLVRFLDCPLSPAQADALAGDALGPGHHARLVLAALERLDLADLTDAYAGRGSGPCQPLPLLAAVYET